MGLCSFSILHRIVSPPQCCCYLFIYVCMENDLTMGILHPVVGVTLKLAFIWTRPQQQYSFLNSCVNPVALYCVSGVFRQHFHRYLCCKQIQQTHHRLGMSMATNACDTSFMSTIRRTQHGNHHTIVHNGSSPTQSIILNEKRWGTFVSEDTFL